MVAPAGSSASSAFVDEGAPQFCSCGFSVEASPVLSLASPGEGLSSSSLDSISPLVSPLESSSDSCPEAPSFDLSRQLAGGLRAPLRRCSRCDSARGTREFLRGGREFKTCNSCSLKGRSYRTNRGPRKTFVSSLPKARLCALCSALLDPATVSKRRKPSPQQAALQCMRMPCSLCDDDCTADEFRWLQRH